MSRRPRQLGVRDPDVLLLLPLLARPHRHAPILRTKSVDTSEVFVYESGLAPRAARLKAVAEKIKRFVWVVLPLPKIILAIDDFRLLRIEFQSASLQTFSDGLPHFLGFLLRLAVRDDI